MFVLTLVFAGFSFCKNQKSPAPHARINSVPKIVRTTVFAVFDCGGGGTYACAARGRTGGTAAGCEVGITMRSPDPVASALRIMTVSSPRSSSIFSLGMAVKLGWASSISGVPSLVQNLMISSSNCSLHLGQYFIMSYLGLAFDIRREFGNVTFYHDSNKQK